MLKLEINVEGQTVGDLELAIEEVLKSVRRGCVEGFDRNDSGNYHFTRTGEEEE